MKGEQSVCSVKNLDHVCIAVRDIEDTLRFFQTVFGIGSNEIVDIEDQKVRRHW